MKKGPVALLAPLLLATLLPAMLFAQSGIFSSAAIREQGTNETGIALIVPSIGILGFDRFGLNGLADVGLRAGIMHDDGLNRFQIGADGRYGFMQTSEDDPADVDLVALFHLSTGQTITQWSFAVGPQAGSPLELSGSDIEIAPYAGVLLGAIHTGSGGTTTIDGVEYQIPKTSKTDFGALIPLGARIDLGGDIDVFGEIDITIASGSDAKAAFGATYRYR